MTTYIKLPDGEPTTNLQTLLPNTINPENLPAAEREAQGVYECVITQPTVAWHQQRGERIIDTEARPVTVTWAVLDRPIEDVRALAWERVKSERGTRREAGVPITFPGAIAGTVQTRAEQDQVNLLAIHGAALALSGDPTATVQLTDGENRTHELTPTEAIQITMTVFAALTALHQQSQTMRTAIDAAQTVAEIAAAAEWV